MTNPLPSSEITYEVVPAQQRLNHGVYVRPPLSVDIVRPIADTANLIGLTIMPVCSEFLCQVPCAQPEVEAKADQVLALLRERGLKVTRGQFVPYAVGRSPFDQPEV